MNKFGYVEKEAVSCVRKHIYLIVKIPQRHNLIPSIPATGYKIQGEFNKFSLLSH